MKQKTTKDHEENDENPAVACTLQLHKWNKKGGGENIVVQLVMEVNVKPKPKLDEPSTSRGGMRCTLYEAQKQEGCDENHQHHFKTGLAGIDASIGFA